MPRQKAASLTIQWRISQKQKTCDRLFLSNIFYGNFLGSINKKYKNSSEQRNDVTKKNGGGGTLPSTGMWQGEVFAISDCLVVIGLLLIGVC